MSRRRSASYEVARRLLRTVNPGNARLDLSSLRSGRDNEVHWSSLTAPASYAVGFIASFWMIERVQGIHGDHAA